MKKLDFKSSDSEETSSSSNEASLRVRRLMNRIFKKGKDVTTQNDVDQMVEKCTNIFNEINTKTISEKTISETKRPVIRRGSRERNNLKLKQNDKKQTDMKKDFHVKKIRDGLKDLLEKKKEKSDFNEFYEKNMNEIKKKSSPPSKSEIMKLFGKPLDHSWRKKIEAFIDQDSSESIRSSDLSSNNSDTESREEKLSQKAMNPNNASRQENIKDGGSRDWFSQSKEEVDDAKRKAREWLKIHDPNLAEGFVLDELNKTFDNPSSDSYDSDPFPTRLPLQKKTEDQIRSIKAKLGISSLSLCAKQSRSRAASSSRSSQHPLPASGAPKKPPIFCSKTSSKERTFNTLKNYNSVI